MNTQARQFARRRGISLVETVVALVVLSGAMVATLNSVAGARASQVMVGERAKARLLAESMLQEVLAQPYAEPGTTTIGPDTGEASKTLRDQFDDVDDYHGWECAANTPDGTLLPGYEDYEVHIQVSWVKPDELDHIENDDTGVKRVVVTIYWKNREVIVLHGWAAAP